MEFINNLGPVSKLLYKSNVCAVRYLGYYFDEQLTETNLYGNTYLMVNARDAVPDNTTCLMVNVKISFERLHQVICESAVKAVIFFKDLFVENIDTNSACKSVTTLVCYNLVSLHTVHHFFPNVRHLYIFRQHENFTGSRRRFKLPDDTITYAFEHLQQLHIYSSGSSFRLVAPRLEQFSVYSTAASDWTLDLAAFPRLHTLRLDEKIRPLQVAGRPWKVLQFFPTSTLSPSADSVADDVLQLKGVPVDDLLLPPTRKYTFELRKVSSLLGVYVHDREFFAKTLTIDVVGIQIFDNVYPLKMCSLRFTNMFYKYFPYPGDIGNELIERFNIQKQRENLLLIFNFDFMAGVGENADWQECYKLCIETYHRIPIIMQNAQLLLEDAEGHEKTWPNTVNKVRKECCILLPEEELLYVNCSPLRLQTLVEKINKYRENKFIVSKLWLVTNGFEINTKDIEDRVDNLVIVHNEIKMYVTF